MSEFNSRINAQRQVIKLVNSFNLYEEPLFSRSGKAIDRWVLHNSINPKQKHVLILKDISLKLLFLANKSQEQITEDYKNLSTEVTFLMSRLKTEILNFTEAK